MGKAYNILRIALICAALALILVFSHERDDGKLRIYFLDIGQGDAIYVRSPNGHDMLVDGGPSSIVLRRLSEVMPWYDRSIDVVIESHPDSDHIGGLADVLRRYKVGLFMEPGIESDNSIDDELTRLRKEKGIDDILARRGMRIDFGDESSFDILFPDSDPSRFPDTNTASIVGQVRYGSSSAMLAGDSPKAIESYLFGIDGAGLRSDILKAGHHGSRTSSGEEYLKAVAPLFAVISAGKDNRYGHPHKEVIDMLDSLGIGIFRTDRSGTIGFQSDGSSFVHE